MTEISYLVLTFLANALWQVTLVAGGAGCGALLLRRAPARYRHALWVAALLIGLTLPLSMSFQSFNIGDGGQHVRSEYSGTAAEGLGARRPPPAHRTGVSAIVADPFIPLKVRPALIVAGLYFLFLLYRSCRLWHAWRRTGAIRRTSSAADLTIPLEAVIRQYRDELRVGRSEIRVSRSVGGPLTLGALRPAVILPERLLTEAPAEVLAAALGHELAHIRRRDFVTNLFYELLLLPLSFHPAAVQMKRGIDRTRELACDELVSERLIDARAYARSLVGLAESASSPRTAACALGIHGADNLEERVMRLMNRSASLGVRSGRALAAVAATALCVACVIAGSFSVRVSGSPQERGGSAGQFNIAAAPVGQALSPGSLLKVVMELNHAGRWREAAQLAEAVRRAPEASHAERCEAYVSGAYAYGLLKEQTQAVGSIKAFEEECADLPDTVWQRQEARRIGDMLNGIEPVTATDLNRAGEWAKAAEASQRVLTLGSASHDEQCQAYIAAAYAYARLKKYEPAQAQLRQFEERCADLPAVDWLRTEARRLKAEIE